METNLTRQWLRAERAALARASGKRKLDLILDSSDPGALVRSLPAEDLYFAIQEIGVADASPLVQLASPGQFRSFVDLDGWKGEEVDPERVLLWLRLARGDDDDEYKDKLAALDMEVIELLLRGIVRIFDLEEEGDPDEDFEGTVERTPEGRFLLVFEEKGAEYYAARRMIDDLYADDPFRAARLLYSVRWELESELTETALRWRNNRLADLGFPSAQEAASLYAKVPLDAPLPPPGGAPAEPPGFFLASIEGGSLLDRALGLVPDEARDDLQAHLVALLNAAIVADKVDATDIDAVRAEAKAVRDTLALGLESLAGDDPVKASVVLTGSAMKRIFQVGFTRTLELKWRAERLLKSLPLRLPKAVGLLPETPDGEALEALLLRRPRYAGGLDGPAAPPRVRAFATLAELQRAASALDRAEAVAGDFARLGFDADAFAQKVVEAWGEAGLARVHYGEIFATAAARNAVGLGFTFDVLPEAKLDEAVRAAFDEGGKLRASFRESALQAFGGDRFFAEGALARLEGELGPHVASGDVDARFASPWIVD